MPAAVRVAPVGHVLGQLFQERLQPTGGHATPRPRGGRGLFKRRPGGRQGGGAQRAETFGVQRPHPELFGPVVALVKILSHPGKATGVIQTRPAGGLVSGATEPLTIHETFHRHNRMRPAGQPVGGEPGAAQGQRARSQIGQLLRVGQNAEAGVVGQQRAAGGQERVRPADPGIARTQVPGGRAPAQQGQPSALLLGDVTEMFTDEGGVFSRGQKEFSS